MILLYSFRFLSALHKNLGGLCLRRFGFLDLLALPFLLFLCRTNSPVYPWSGLYLSLGVCICIQNPILGPGSSLTFRSLLLAAARACFFVSRRFEMGPRAEPLHGAYDSRRAGAQRMGKPFMRCSSKWACELLAAG
jgi:hypothetical protein